MLEKLQEFLHEECQLEPPAPVLVGVSGGPDSLCLFDLLQRAGFEVAIGHLDHGMRAESAGEAAFVQALGADRGVKTFHRRIDVSAAARREKLSLEEAARTARYRFLFEAAVEVGAQAVAVGHTADDQVETVLMHLLQGAALPGMRGMLPHTTLHEFNAEIPLVRPLLATWRTEVLAYCEAHGLNPVTDASNQDRRFLRNRIRLELIPQLETYNPQIREVLWRNARRFGEAYEVFSAAIESVLQEVVVSSTDRVIVLDHSAYRGLSKAVRSAVLHRALRALRPEAREIDHDTVSRAEAYASQPAPTGEIVLPAGLYLVREDRQILLGEPGGLPVPEGWLQLETEQPLTLTGPGQILLGNRWEIDVQTLGSPEAIIAGFQHHSDPMVAWVDGDKLAFPMEIRVRRPGDRISPLGMGGRSQKLSDLMINEKMPRRARQRWPLLVHQGEIVWVPGYRQAESCRVTAKTKRVLRLAARKVTDRPAAG